jgi:beta-glucanase (GH16 family)
MKFCGNAFVTKNAVILLVCLATVDGVHAQVPNLPGWQLLMNDEFDGTSLNDTLWEALDRQDSFNNEKQYYLPEQVTVADGNLQITATDERLANKAYRSGLITSQALYGPGRFEARIDLPTTQGMWPAFWLNANDVPWPQGGEIDILENRGSQPLLTSSAYHWQTDPGPCCDQHQYVFQEYTANEGGNPVNFHDGFHTYAVEWEETQLRYYVDGNLYFTVNENGALPIVETPKNIIVNLAVGGDFGGDPDGSTVFPQTMLIDYVRVWVKQSIVPGDGNGDGWVDGLDYLIWAGNFGTHPGPDDDMSDGDYNDDGWVDGLDYLYWANNFGTHAASAVPEPNGFFIIFSGLVAIASMTRSRRQVYVD